MDETSNRRADHRLARSLVLALGALLVSAPGVQALTSFSVADQDGTPVAEFRWLLEEDNTHPAAVGAVDAASLGVSVHHSHAPVVASGTSADLGALLAAVDSAKRYFVSVLPGLPGSSVKVGDFALGGVSIAPGQASATVHVHANPLPSAQLSVYAFHDRRSLNSEPDIGNEEGLAGFEVRLYDAVLGEQSFFDFCGNPLGTTYNGAACDDVASIGNGIILTGSDGEVTVQNLYPGKYAVEVVPTTQCPDGSEWIQTSTIEGKHEVDAFVEAGGPQFLPEFGYLLWHTFFGFVCRMDFPAPGPEQAVATVTGAARQKHVARPPAFGAISGIPIPDAIIGVNDLLGADQQVYTGFANPTTGEFTIPNVPPGLYQLVVWDRNLDAIISFHTFSVNQDGDDVDLGTRILSEMWFHRLEGFVFYDTDEDGFRDPGEVGLPGQGLGLRYRDGSINQETETKLDPEPGFYAFDEIFPFLKFLILEINFDRFKATGASFQVDEGGIPGDPPGIAINPQTPPPGEECGDDPSFRCETGVVLLEALKPTLTGANDRADFGKKNYVVGPDNQFGTADDIPGENGGLAGIVYYASTRAEFDPRFAAGDPWEPGVARVQIVLYQDSAGDGVIDDTNGTPGIQLADVDNHPIGWSDGGSRGPEDVERDGNSGSFGLGDALEFAHADSWDDSVPDMAPCPGPLQEWQGTPLVDCAETLRTGGQIRPQVFDGGYAFDPVAPGRYIVEAVAPPGYEHVKDGDLNVLTGDSYVPAFLPSECVGNPYVVPAELTIDGVSENPSPMAGQTRNLCDRKKIRLAEGENQALVDFFVFTHVPKAGRVVGLITDDVQGEFDTTHPRYRDKLGPPWMPVSLQDFAGNEFSRVYTDEFGEFNALVPSNWTANVPSPSGFAPNMVKVVLNPPTFADGTPDPNHNPFYMPVSYVRDFLPGKTTYLDVPTLPRSPRSTIVSLDCEDADGTPRLGRVDGPGGGPVLAPGDSLTLTSMGMFEVPNPAFTPSCLLTPSCPVPPTITRNYGFGTTPGGVLVGIEGLPITSWSDATIVAEVPADTAPGPHQLLVITADGRRSAVGITVHVLGAGYDPPMVRVSAGESIQAAIDGAAEGTLILVEPGVYEQNLLVWKRVKLQGFGAGTTILDGRGFGAAEQEAWSSLLQSRVVSGDVDLVPGQDPELHLVQGAVVAWFEDEAAIGGSGPDRRLLDGFAIREGTRGGGVHVNAYVRNLEISNDVIQRNQGNFGGGIRLGTPTLADDTGLGWRSSENHDAQIHNNLISDNGGVSGGGGIALFNGSDGYEISDNTICGNFSLVYGGGIQHFGLSPGGVVERNAIRFNHSFDEGGGLFVGSEPSPPGATVDTLGPGTGDVTVNRNLFLANVGHDDGGAIQALDVNGQDVAASSDPANWYRLRITNNMIVNNVSEDVGGGINLDDTVRAEILHNTIAYNNSTSTNEDNFALLAGGPTFGDPDTEQLGITTPLPAGLSALVLDSRLQAVLPPGSSTFANPLLYDNIIFGNRAFYYDHTGPNVPCPPGNPGGGPGNQCHLHAADGPDSKFVPPPGQPDFFNLGVIGGTGSELFMPEYNVLTQIVSTNGTSFSATNLVETVDYLALPHDDLFVAAQVSQITEVEHGAGEGPFFTVRLTVRPPSDYNYHLRRGTSAKDAATSAIPGGPFPELGLDFDGNARGSSPDIGADERGASVCGLGAEIALVAWAVLLLRVLTRRRTS